jgi:hypothetical protein
MATKKKLLQAAAGAATAGGGALNVEDVFSTYLYDGTSSTQTITNGIDLSGEGGLVWAKARSTNYGHMLFDTERGAGNYIRTDSNTTEASSLVTLSSFNSDGFTLGNNNPNISPQTFASWTFRKAPKFFDVVTYTGDGTSGRLIPHNLGSQPGCVIIKRTDSTSDWVTYHRSLSQTYYYLKLNTTDDTFTSGGLGSGAHTSTDIEVGYGFVNTSGGTYVAYLFAHNDGDGEFGPDGDADIIKCGSYTGNGSTTGPVIDLGFEPQWLLIKNVTTSGANWFLMDNMRGLVNGVTAGTSDGADPTLFPNLSNAEVSSGFNSVSISATGFSLNTTGTQVNASGDTHIYIAIRRGPMAVPTDATEVFKPVQYDGTKFPTGFPVDFAIAGNAAGTDKWYFQSRLQGAVFFNSASTAAEVGSGSAKFDLMDGYGTAFSTAYYTNAFRRAPNFFDVVCYDGGSNPINHNLGVTPEMIWVKRRDSTNYGAIYHKDTGLSKNFDMPSSSGAFSNPTYTSVNSASFSGKTNYSNINQSGGKYVAYLFASLDGVSKVGSYTGNGTSQTIDCGFSSGARFVLIKRSDSSGDWNFYDTERGIVAGNDGRMSLNTTDANDTSSDRIDPNSSGFTVNYIATGTSDSNISGANYIFYAVA